MGQKVSNKNDKRDFPQLMEKEECSSLKFKTATYLNSGSDSESRITIFLILSQD